MPSTTCKVYICVKYTCVSCKVNQLQDILYFLTYSLQHQMSFRDNRILTLSQIKQTTHIYSTARRSDLNHQHGTRAERRLQIESAFFPLGQIKQDNLKNIFLFLPIKQKPQQCSKNLVLTKLLLLNL